MIKYHLACGSGHEFESWFRSIADYDTQLQSGAVACPTCGSIEIAKQPMAPAVVSSKSKSRTEARSFAPPAPNSSPVGASPSAAAAGILRAFKQAVIETSEDVGPRFTEEARKIHFGDAEERNIRGSATAEEAQSLREDGIPFGILPPLPEDLN